MHKISIKLFTSCSFLLILMIGCKDSSTLAETKPSTISYPQSMLNIFAAHGGLDKWKSMHSLSYDIVKEEQNEKQYIDLDNRRERIEASNVTMGYDGTNFWMEADTSYKGNPIFYKNLMFYFYAMPFVLADEGIVYTKAEPLSFEGVDYPGYRISYNQGVGVSPEDEYFIHFNSETNKMEWLGYTVTYYSKEKSETIKWIRYDDWDTVNGLILPKSIAWHKTENNTPVEFRNRVNFTNIQLTDASFDDSQFEKTQHAEIVTQ